jgi:hypothetical protein
MADLRQLERALGAVLWQLREYLGDLVVIGGWVPHLYRRYGGFATWTLETSLTAEVDLLVGPDLRSAHIRSIPEVLRAAGFEPDSEGAAAVWSKDAASGEKIEFLIAHQGTARQQGRVVAVPGQASLGAISLAGLDLLGRHTSVLTVPIGLFENEMVMAQVRIPRLGAYVVNKAVTFPYRARRANEVVNPKRAKDLLYLRDLMAVGGEVVDRIEQDLREIANTDPVAVNDITNARNNLSLLLNGSLSRMLAEVAAAVSVRSRQGTDVAIADVIGYFTDLLEIVEAVLREEQGLT